MIHDDALALLAGWTPPSPHDEALRDRYVAHLEEHPDGLLKACFPDHLTAGAIVVSRAGDAVLLNHHRKADAWLAFGSMCVAIGAAIVLQRALGGRSAADALPHGG